MKSEMYFRMSLGSADLPTSASPKFFFQFFKEVDCQGTLVPSIYESRALPLSYRDKKERCKIFKKLCEAV